MSALWCPLATPTILLGFLLSWVWGSSSQLLQQSAAAAPYLGQRVSPHCLPPDLQCGIAPLGPPEPVHPPLLGSGLIFLAAAPGLRGWVAPPGFRPWPWTWGGSSQPPTLASYTGWLLQTVAPDLRHGVAPPRHTPLTSTWGGSSRPFLRHCSLALSAAAPDLGCGVAPLSHLC